MSKKLKKNSNQHVISNRDALKSRLDLGDLVQALPDGNLDQALSVLGKK